MMLAGIYSFNNSQKIIESRQFKNDNISEFKSY
jgi:hypothetical protein